MSKDSDFSRDNLGGRRVIAIYLSTALVLAGVATSNPWLHNALEHLSFDDGLAHVHGPHDSFDHSHATSTAHSYLYGHSGHSGNSDDEENNPSEDHEHRGLSKLIAGGLVEVADGSIDMPLPAKKSVDFGVQFSTAEYLPHFDFVQSIRPPPHCLRIVG